MESSYMDFDEFIAYLKKFVDKESFFQEANEVEKAKGYKDEDYKKLNLKVNNIKKECNECENEMEEAIEKELKELKEISWFKFVISDDDLRATPITSNLFGKYINDSSKMEIWTQKLVWTFLRRKFFGTKNEKGKIEGGMVDIKKLKQKEIEQILEMLTSPVQNNSLPVSNLFESRCICEKCHADDSKGIFNSQFLLQDLVNIYGIDVNTNGITTEQGGTKADEYEKYELTEDDKKTIMTFTEFDDVDANKNQFPGEYAEYEKFLLKYCGFETLEKATEYVTGWKTKSGSTETKNPDTDPQNTKCKRYYAEYRKDYSEDNPNYLGKLSSQLKNDATNYITGDYKQTEKYMSFDEYKNRFHNTNLNNPNTDDVDDVIEKLKQAKNQSSPDKSQNSILFSSGFEEPKTLENGELPEDIDIYDENNFYGVDIKGMDHQSYSAGCGSTVAATMMTYEGLNLTQYEIRTYVPENIDNKVWQNNGFGNSSRMHNPAIFSDIIIKYKNNMAVRNLVIDWSNNKRTLNFKSYVLPNLVKMVNKCNGEKILDQKDEKKLLESGKLKASEEEIKARAEYLRLCIIDAIVKHKSPISLNTGGHYRLIVGIQGNLIKILDPDSPRNDKTLITDIESIVRQAKLQIDLLWFEHLDLKNVNNQLKLKSKDKDVQVYDEQRNLCEDTENFKQSPYGGDFKKFMGTNTEDEERMENVKKQFPDADKTFEVTGDFFLPQTLVREQEKVEEEEKDKKVEINEIKIKKENIIEINEEDKKPEIKEEIEEKIEEEKIINKGLKTIGQFINAINEQIKNDQKLKGDLNKAVESDLPKDEEYFKDLSEFVNFLPTTLKNYFTKEIIKEILGKDWEDFEIEKKDLEELYKINLEDKTKLAIIKKFKIKQNKLSMTDDINKAISTFKKILGEVKVSISDFYDFIDDNIAHSEMLLSQDLNDILDCVKSNGAKDKFKGYMFWNICYKFKEQPSEKLINFMVQNTDFNKLSIEDLMFTIIILMRKHFAYLKDNTKENIFNALNDILNGNEPYQKFSEALLSVPDIADRIKLEDIIKNSTDTSVLNFVANLISNGIEIKIKLDGGSGNKKFVVDGKKVYANDELVKFLLQEPDLNKWLKGIFSGSQTAFNSIYNDKNDENKDKAKENLIIANKDKMDDKVQKVKILDELIQKMSKANAIKSFIEKSKDSNRLKKIYRKLPDEDLNKMALPEDIVEWCLDGLSCVIPGDGLMFNKEQMNNIKSLLEYWGGNSKEKEAFLQKLLLAWKYDKKNQNIRSAISYMFSNRMLPTGQNFISGYGFSNLLIDTPDGKVSIDFIKHIGNNGSVDFANLVHDTDKCFGQCLFRTIYHLIRTAENYDSKNPEKQKQAINDVLVKGENYQWFCEGLKTFFQKAKDGKNRTAKDIDMEDILKEIPDLAKLLQNCKLELKFEYNEENPENSTLKVEETKLVMDKKIEIKKDHIEDTEITKEALSNLANDENLPAYIAQYNYENVTTLKELKQNVLKAFIGSNEEKTKKYKLLKDEDLENCELPSNVIDDLLFHLPSHKIQIKDNLNEMITSSSNSNEKMLNKELDELQKLYGKHGVSSAGALYFMVACSKNSLTIEQQNKILELHSKKQLGEESKVIEGDNENIKDELKSSQKATFSKALAALESIEDGQAITFRLIDFICDNVAFSGLKDNDAKEIDNFYGIVYHWIAHNSLVIPLIKNDQSKDISELPLDGIKCVFSETFNKDQNQEAPYTRFWQEIRKSKKDFLGLLSGEKIKEQSKQNEDGSAKKLNDLLDKLKVRIKIEEDKISVQSVQEQEKLKEEDITNNQLNNAFIGRDENDSTKKSKFPTWAKVLIAFVIAAFAVLALLCGFGVLGALAGTELMVARIVAVLAIFAELIYLAVVLPNMNRTDDGPGGRGPGSDPNLIGLGNNTIETRSIVTDRGKGQKSGEVPITGSGSEMTGKDEKSQFIN